MEKELQHFQEMQILDVKDKKSISIFAESVEKGKISASTSEWKMGLGKLFVTCLNDDNDKIAKPIKNYLGLFINTSLNHMSIRSRLESQPNKNLILRIYHLLSLVLFYLPN